MFNCFLSLFVSVQVSDAYFNVLSIVVLFSLNFSLIDMFLFLKVFCNISIPFCIYIYIYFNNFSPKTTSLKEHSNLIN